MNIPINYPGIISQEPIHAKGKNKIELRELSIARDLSGAGDGVSVFVVEFLRIGMRRGARIGFFFVSGHLVSKGGNVLVDLPCHSIFTGSLCESNSCAVLGKMGRLAGRTLQATTGDHDRNRAFLDEIVGGGTEKNTGGGGVSGRQESGNAKGNSPLKLADAS